MKTNIFDVLIVGGGINGASAARDAAGRGLSVALCEAEDIGWATSSASSKLIHGGLRYLEHYEFRLVREALAEREVILATAPHIAWPMRIVLPHAPWLRPAWLIRAGLFLYDHLSPLQQIAGSERVNLKKHVSGRSLVDKFKTGFEYSDLGVLDTRFCLYNAMDASMRGASVFTRTRVEKVVRKDGVWCATTVNTRTGETAEIKARSMVNTTGPWSNEFLTERAESSDTGRIRMVLGSHIIVPKLYDHPYSYILQNDDKRIVFVIPYENDFTMIGTTDVDYQGDPAKAACSQAEREYLCKITNDYFRTQIKAEDVVWDFAGIRPLYSDGKDATSATRDYVFKVEKGADGSAPLLNVFGGKITAGREIGEKIVDQLLPLLGRTEAPEGSHWTATAPFPGGDMPEGFEPYLYKFHRQYPWLPARMAHRLCRHYGTLAHDVLGDAKSLAALGQHFGADLYEAEVRYQQQNEWADDADGVLWRRTRLGLHMTKEEQDALRQWFGA
ncbi:glycerol-3-phosphate dehydrogenase [Oleidesulfovibrio sp.]|uniref:glycerol-3-phosphate dehydrogenase n=1 Tax=Oleidesulfovibrio sp. TaxID=2909707 RepID=UPI003A8705AF